MRWVALALVLVVACGGSDGPSGDCTDGQTRECYQGPPGTQDVGTCISGVETCVDGTFNGICVGDVTPFVEHCDGRDEDCNGAVDDAEGTGTACIAADGCEGATACDGAGIACLAPAKNQCGVCGGPSVDEVGMACTIGDCDGTQLCNTAGDGTECSALPQNACGLCGGPVVNGLGDTCGGATGCAGRLTCNAAGTATTCDCSENLCNDGGTLRAIVAPGFGELVITEVMPNPAAVADVSGEWFEVRVLADVDLNGLGLDRASDTSGPDTIVAFDCVRVAAGSTLVFARSADPALNGGIPGTIAGTFTFSLIDGTAAAPGDVQLVVGATVIDTITWTSTRSGASHQLDPGSIDAVANDSESAFCDATAPYGAGDLGTPNADNTTCPLVVPPGSCNAGGTVRAIVKPSAGALVITEVMVNPKIENVVGQEWFEITNTGIAAFDMNDLGLDQAAGTRPPDLVRSNSCISVPPGGFALFARSTDPALNAGLTGIDATYGFALANTGGDLQVLDGASVLDAITWGGVGAATFDGKSLQLDPDEATITGNDVPASTVGQVWCLGTVGYGDGTNLGTPRSANAQCP